MLVRTALVGLLLGAAATAPALAQTMDTDASAWSQSVNQNQIIVGGAGGGGGTHRQEIDYSGSYSVKSVPDALAPMIPGGANPCVVGMSAAGSVVGFGASMGGSWNDADCERRNLSIILLNAADKFVDPTLATAAIELLCANEDVEEAMSLAGRPCLRSATTDQQATRQARPQTASAEGEWDWIDDPRMGR